MISPKPKTPKPNPIRLKKRKRMTICAGFKSMYGVVLSADTQETLGSTKIRIPKLVIKPHVGEPTDKVRMLFAGAGDGIFVDRLIEEMWKAAERCKGTKIGEVFEDVETALVDWHTKIWKVYAGTGDKPDSELIFAIYVLHEIRLYKAFGPTVTEIQDYAFIGCGRELAEFLVDHVRVDTDSIEEDFATSLYIISNVKEHVDDCGGDTQIAALFLDGSIQTMNTYQAGQLTQGIQDIARSIFYLFSVACNSESSRDDVNRTARGTATEINRIRAALKKSVPDRVRVSQELKDSVQTLYQRIEWPPTD